MRSWSFPAQRRRTLVLVVVFLAGVAVFALAARSSTRGGRGHQVRGLVRGYDQSRYLRITTGLAD